MAGLGSLSLLVRRTNQGRIALVIAPAESAEGGFVAREVSPAEALKLLTDLAAVLPEYQPCTAKAGEFPPAQHDRGGVRGEETGRRRGW